MRRAAPLLVLALTLAGCIGQTAPPAAPGAGLPAPTPEGLGWRDAVALPDSDFPAQVGTTCTEKDDGDAGCGLDEPSVVVDATGRVFYTAACCIAVTSPVWVSEDGGATFRALAHPAKQGGGEGDISVDAQGELYYMDIDLASFGIARWSADLSPQEYTRRPGVPLVDRPWVRATADGVVMAIYNTGTSTVAYRSEDRGLTFSLLPVATFPAALAGAYSDSRRGIVGMVGNGQYQESRDHGATWEAVQDLQGCGTDRGSYASEGAAVDEAGTVWHLRSGCVVGRTEAGATAESRAIPEDFEVAYAWIAAGAPGGVAVVWYGQVADEAAAQRWNVAADAWHVWLAWRADPAGAGPWNVALAVPDPVAAGSRGDLGRRLGDFLQVAIGPDGAVHVAYASNPELDDSATAMYRRTAPIAALAPSQPLVGPLAAAAAGATGAAGRAGAAIGILDP